MANHYADIRRLYEPQECRANTGAAGAGMRDPLIRLSVPGVPVAQPRQRHRAFVVGGQARVQNYTPATHPVQSFKALLALTARKAWKKAPLEGPLRVEVTFLFPLPASTKASVRKQVEAGVWVPHITKPDADNCIKAVKDGLNGILWQDDKLISEGVWRKGYGQVPGVEIAVWAL